jgi:hypothetical protein
MNSSSNGKADGTNKPTASYMMQHAKNSSSNQQHQMGQVRTSITSGVLSSSGNKQAAILAS